MKNNFLIVVIFLVTVYCTYGQNNIGIGTQTPHTSAILEVSSTTKGLLQALLIIYPKTS
jgi:hypothetical protein